MSQEDAPKFELLSVALGSEFSECSIAAAELNKQVYEELNGVGTRQKLLLPIDEDPVFGRKFVTKRLGWTITSGDDEFRLALVRPADTAPGRRSIFRRAVENTVDVAGQHPQLVAILGDEDAFVPLATFARREGGQVTPENLSQEDTGPGSAAAEARVQASIQRGKESQNALLGHTQESTDPRVNVPVTEQSTEFHPTEVVEDFASKPGTSPAIAASMRRSAASMENILYPPTDPRNGVRLTAQSGELPPETKL